MQPTIDRLRVSIPQAGGELADARPIPPVLEDVFIALADLEA